MELIIGVAWLAMIVALFMRLRRRRGRIGPGAAGMVYDMLNEDKRQAVEVVVEKRAEYQDPESRDGNLPALEALQEPPVRRK